MKKKFNFNRKQQRKIIIYLALTLVGLTILLSSIIAYEDTLDTTSEVSYSEVFELIESGEVDYIAFASNKDSYTVYLKDGTSYISVNPDYEEFKKDLMEAGADVRLEGIDSTTAAVSVLSTLVSLIFVLFMISILLSLVPSSVTGQFENIDESKKNTTFDDIAGLRETKEEVKFAVEQIKNAKELKQYGIRPCKGILFVGPPGTGKTMLAKAIAGEAGANFISCAGSDFVELYAGNGAAKVRKLWRSAEQKAPCVIFIDEIDAVGAARSGRGGSEAEWNQTLNAILQKMDGVDSSSGIFVVAATNRKEALDPALTRPGRFDRIIQVGPPVLKEDRDEIIKLYLGKVHCDDTVNIDAVSNICYGMTGADIANVINEAGLSSLRKQRKGVISLSDIDDAAMKLRMQGVVKSHASTLDKARAAVHEAGHAIVAMTLGRKVAKVSVVPYSNGVGGITIQDAEQFEDSQLRTKSDYEVDLTILLAGYAAEKALFGEVSLGSSSDIEKASKIAYTIYDKCGMSDDRIVSESAIYNNKLLNQYSKDIIEEINKYLLSIRDYALGIASDNKSKIINLANMLMDTDVVNNPSLDELDTEYSNKSEDTDISNIIKEHGVVKGDR